MTVRDIMNADVVTVAPELHAVAQLADFVEPGVPL